MVTIALPKFAGHRFYESGDVNFYMNISEKAKLTALICRIDRFSEPIHNYGVSDN